MKKFILLSGKILLLGGGLYLLSTLVVTSCSRNDISSKEYYRDVPSLGGIANSSEESISGIHLVPIKVDSMETSYVGYFWNNRDTLYYSDLYYHYIYSLRPDGSIIERYIGRGQGPDEVINFDFSIPFADGYYLHSTYSHYRYFFDNYWKKTNHGHVFWCWKRWTKQEYGKRVNNPVPSDRCYYEDDVLSYILTTSQNQIQRWDSTHVAVYVSCLLPKFNGYDNSSLYYNYSRIIALVDVHTGEVERVIGRRPPVYLEKSNIPNMDHAVFSPVDDTVFVSFFPDSIIYMIDKAEDRPIGQFGQQGRNMNTSYVRTHTIKEAEEREKKDWDTFGFYTYLKYDEKRQWLFRGYRQGAHSQYDGLQIYKNHTLIGDVDVPKGFYLIGYLNDQLIGGIEDTEIKELDLHFYQVNFEIDNTKFVYQ